MRRVLVTGGLGFIGANLVDRMISMGEVTVLDDQSSGRLNSVQQHADNPKFRFVDGSVLDPVKIDEAMQNADAVVHLAAVVSVNRSLEDPYLVHKTNVEGTLNVLESCLRHSVEKMIFISSAAVYGNHRGTPLSEETRSDPSNLYGATKAAGEAYVNAFHETDGLETVILRMMNVYGPGRSPGPYAGVITQFAQAVSEGKPLLIFGDGEQTRDFVYISDVIDSILGALESPRAIGNTLNIGTGIASSVNQLARVFSKLSQPELPIQHLPPRTGDVKRSCADIEKARKILSYNPKVLLEKGIESYMQWFRLNYENFLREIDALKIST